MGPTKKTVPDDAVYTIHLQKTGDITKLGVDIRKTADGLLITADRNSGLVKVWNEEHPDAPVKEKDIITSVNEVTGPADQLLEEIKNADILRILLRRGAAGEAVGNAPL